MSLFEYNLYKKRVKQIYLERANKDQKTTLDTTISLATALTSSAKMISQWFFFFFFSITTFCKFDANGENVRESD